MPAIRRKFRKLMDQFSRKPQVMTCTLGDENGVVEIPGVPNMVWVRKNGRGQRIAVHNFTTAKAKGLVVKVGEDELNPGIRQVLGLAVYPGAVYGNAPTVPPHASTHVRGGSDQIYIDLRQVINVLPFPNGGLVVKIYTGYVLSANGMKLVKVNETVVDLTSFMPASLAKYVLLSVDETGAVSVTSGDSVAYADLTLDDAPGVPDGDAPIAWVRLYVGQTSISDAFSNSDIIDGRFIMRTMGLALDDLTDVAIDDPADNELLTYDGASGEWINQTAAEAGLSQVGHTHVEADITDLDHDASKIRGKDVPAPTAGDDGKALIFDNATDEFIFGEAGGGSGGGGDLFWYMDGALAAETEIGQVVVASKAMTISKVIVHLKETGSAGSTIVDININGLSIFTSAPEIAYDDADGILSVVPDTTSISADDLISVDIDQAATGAESLTVCVVVSSESPSSAPVIWSHGRLTLTSATPVTTADVTAAETIYFTPYLGNLLSIYGGTSWETVTFEETSLSLAALSANTNYDIFAYKSSGTLTLEAVAWSSATARATALAWQDGIRVKSGDATKRLVGAIRITSTAGQCEDSIAKRFVVNYLNPVERLMYFSDSNSHTYTGTAERYWNNSSSNKLGMFLPFEEMVWTNNLGIWGKIGNASYAINVRARFDALTTGVQPTWTLISYNTATLRLFGARNMNYALIAFVGYKDLYLIENVSGNTGTFDVVTLEILLKT